MTWRIRDRGFGFALGVLTFVGAHAIEVALWTVWFGGAHDPWFLNSGQAIVFTMACLLGVSTIGGALGLSGFAIAAGSFVAMTMVMFLKQGGPGTIFPIVMVVGGALMLMSTTVGAWFGRRRSATHTDRSD